MKFFLLAVLFFAYVQGGCYDCSPESGLSCVSSNKFQVCINDVRTGKIHTCPEDTICSAVGHLICVEPGIDTIQTCPDSQCDDTNTFSCTGMRTFSLCFGTTVPSDVGGSCKQNEVCNMNNPFICEKSAIFVEHPDYDAVIVQIDPPGNRYDSEVDNIVEPLENITPEEEPAVEEPPVEEPPVTEPPVTEPPVTEPPVTEPPVTQPPVTEPPVTSPPVTTPPVTAPPVTTPQATSLPVKAPATKARPLVNKTTLFTAKISLHKGGKTKVKYDSNRKVTNSNGVVTIY